MAETKNVKAARAQHRAYSTPVIEGEITLNSDQAQRVFRRGYDQAARALYSLDVILRITQQVNPNFKEAYDTAINHAASLIDTVSGELEKELQRLTHLIEKNGVKVRARYNNAQTIQYAVSTPLASRFAGAVCTLDDVVQLLDTLWLSGVITSHAASEAKYSGQRRLLRVVRTLIGYATSARRSARKAGHAEAVNEALGDATDADAAAAELELQGDSTDGALSQAETAGEATDGATQPAAPAATEGVKKPRQSRKAA